MGNLLLIIAVGLGTLWAFGFIVTMFTTIITGTMSAIDYQQNFEEGYFSTL